MSGKNRAFALAIATAALVGFCAPMASAATVQGPSNTGLNNDSVLNLSNNQVPVQPCTFGADTNLTPVLQVIAPLVPAAGATNDLTTGALSGTQDNGCSQTGDQANGSTTDS
jgi:hypothetical protein